MEKLDEKKQRVKDSIMRHNDQLTKYADESMEAIDYDKIVDDYLENLANEIFSILDIKE